MAFFAPFAVTFATLLVTEDLLSRLVGGMICLLFCFLGRFRGGRPSPWLAPLFLISCLFRLYPLWSFYGETLGEMRGGILFFLTLAAVFFMVARQKDPVLALSRSSVPFALTAIGFGLWAAAKGIPWGIVAPPYTSLLMILLCALSGMLILPTEGSLLLTYAGVGAGILLGSFPYGWEQGLFLGFLSPMVAATELGIVCGKKAYTLQKRKKPRKE